MAEQIQLRRDVASSWTLANPILAQGEIGIELDAFDKFKIGDGILDWNALPYFSQAEPLFLSWLENPILYFPITLDNPLLITGDIYQTGDIHATHFYGDISHATGFPTSIILPITFPDDLVATGNVYLTGNIHATHFYGDISHATGFPTSIILPITFPDDLVATGNVYLTGNIHATHFYGAFDELEPAFNAWIANPVVYEPVIVESVIEGDIYQQGNYHATRFIGLTDFSDWIANPVLYEPIDFPDPLILNGTIYLHGDMHLFSTYYGDGSGLTGNPFFNSVRASSATFYGELELDGNVIDGAVLTNSSGLISQWTNDVGYITSGGFVPYTGATGDLNLGTHVLLDSDGEKSVDPDNRYLWMDSGNVSLSWDGRLLYGDNGGPGWQATNLFSIIPDGFGNYCEFHLYPSASSKGYLRAIIGGNTDNVPTTLFFDFAANGHSYTVADVGADADFVMTEGTQTINGVKSFGSDITIQGSVFGLGPNSVGTNVAAGQGALSGINAACYEMIGIGTVPLLNAPSNASYCIAIGTGALENMSSMGGDLIDIVGIGDRAGSNNSHKNVVFLNVGGIATADNQLVLGDSMNSIKFHWGTDNTNTIITTANMSTSADRTYTIPDNGTTGTFAFQDWVTGQGYLTSLSGALLSNGSVTGAVYNIQSFILGIDSAGPIYPTISQTTVNGTTGTAIWSMPFQGASYKKFLVYLTNFTSAGSVITFPTAFIKTPYVYGTTAAIAIAVTTTTTTTLTSVGAVGGFIFIEGY